MNQVVITQTAIDCALDIEDFNAPIIGRDEAQALAYSLIDDAEAHLSENPLRFRACAEIADYGLDVRERIDSRGYRTLFSVTEGTVEVLLILHQRQDIQGALYRHLVAYKQD
jgi:toxin ParE1/3/4